MKKIKLVNLEEINGGRPPLKPVKVEWMTHGLDTMGPLSSPEYIGDLPGQNASFEGTTGITSNIDEKTYMM
jgi:hypothetical protein